MYNINQCLVWVVKQLNGLWKYQIIGNRVRFNWYFSKASTLIKANRSFHSIQKSWKPIQVDPNRIKNFLSTKINSLHFELIQVNHKLTILSYVGDKSKITETMKWMKYIRIHFVNENVLIPLAWSCLDYDFYWV